MELRSLEQESLTTEFWNDNEHAQRVMRRISTLQAQIEPWQKLHQRVKEALELAELAAMDDQSELVEELRQEATAIATTYEEMEFKLALSGPHDPPQRHPRRRLPPSRLVQPSDSRVTYQNSFDSYTD